MTRNERRHCPSLPHDILSNLPDNVIDVILLCLPSKDAVRTSILSKNWRYHWCRLTELTLDKSLWETREDCEDPTPKFTKIIHQFLSLHEGPITKFTLDITYSLKSCPEIDYFIYSLSRKNIQHLVLHLPWWNICKVPSSLFTCSQLRHLILKDCLIHPLSIFKGFVMLISLKLCRVTISSECLGNLISHCPLLEQLVLDELQSEISITTEINALVLRSFEFHGSTSSIYLKNVPLLAKVSLRCYSKSTEIDIFGYAKFFESCRAVEHLILNYDYSEAWNDDLDEVATRLPFDIDSVKCFYLRHIMLYESYTLQCALCLLRSFPNLEYLKIKTFMVDEDNGCALKSLELARFSDVTFNHLKEVKLGWFKGTAREMQLAKILLAKSPVLVRMLIRPSEPDEPEPETRLKMVAEVSNFPCVSPMAEIVWLE